MMLIRREDAAKQALRPFVVPLSPGHAGRTRPDDGSGPVLPDQEFATELARLQGEVAALEEALEEARVAHEAAIEVALEKGRLEGRQAADELGAERLAALREQLAATSEGCLARFAEQSDLAIEIAHVAVQKILGEATPRAALAGEIVRNAIAQVAAGTLVAIRVSKEDFASDAELAALCAELGGITVARADGLASGGCTLDLTLGSVDASLDVQLASLTRELGGFRTGAAS